MRRRPRVSRPGLWALAAATLALLLVAAGLPTLRTLWDSPRLVRGFRHFLVGSAALAGLAALISLRRHTWRRLLGLLAVGLLAALFLRIAPGEAAGASRLAEQTHLAQFGLLSILYALVLRRRFPDLALHLTAVIFCGAVGLLDELLQWWVPDRVGTLLDVRIDLLGALLGQALCALVLFAGERPLTLAREGQAAALRALAAAFLLLGVFVHVVHLAHPLRLPGTEVVYRSRWSERELERRAASWRPRPVPATLFGRLLQGEDFLAAEARYHVRRRNEALRAGSDLEAGLHQLVLERHYAACLAADDQLRLPAATRDALARSAAGAATLAYDAGPHDRVAWIDPWSWWLLIAVASSGLALLAELRIARPTTSSFEAAG